MSPGGKSGAFSGYYMHIAPGDTHFSAGIYVPTKPALHALRTTFATDCTAARAFDRLLAAKALRPYGPLDTEPLRITPRGFPKQHPRLPLIRARMRHNRRATQYKWQRWGMEFLARNTAFRRYVLRELERRGPLLSRELEDRSVDGRQDHRWYGSRYVAIMLDLLHRHLTLATENITANEEGSHVTLRYPDWQRVMAMQMILARYVRAVAEPDADGVVRAVPLWLPLGERPVPAFRLAVAGNERVFQPLAEGRVQRGQYIAPSANRRLWKFKRVGEPAECRTEELAPNRLDRRGRGRRLQSIDEKSGEPGQIDRSPSNSLRAGSKNSFWNRNVSARSRNWISAILFVSGLPSTVGASPAI